MILFCIKIRKYIQQHHIKILKTKEIVGHFFFFQNCDKLFLSWYISFKYFILFYSKEHLKASVLIPLF